jgi:hypothetical protein
MPTFIRPARVTVETGDGLGGLAMVIAPVVAGAVILGVIAEWVMAYAVVLGAGLTVSCGVVAAEVWVLRRYCTVLTFRQGVRPWRPRAAVTATATRLSAEDRRTLEQVRELLAVAARPPAAERDPIQVPYVITDAVPQPRKELP